MWTGERPPRAMIAAYLAIVAATAIGIYLVGTAVLAWLAAALG